MNNIDALLGLERAWRCDPDISNAEYTALVNVIYDYGAFPAVLQASEEEKEPDVVHVHGQASRTTGGSEIYVVSLVRDTIVLVSIDFQREGDFIHVPPPFATTAEGALDYCRKTWRELLPEKERLF